MTTSANDDNSSRFITAFFLTTNMSIITFNFRLETLDALDKLPELINSDELKNKLLFSVVVVSWVTN